MSGNRKLQIVRRQAEGLSLTAKIEDIYVSAETEYATCPKGRRMPIDTLGIIWSEEGIMAVPWSTLPYDSRGNVLPQSALVTSHKGIPPTVLLLTDRKLDEDRAGAIDELMDQNCRINCASGRDCAILRLRRRR